MYITKFLLFIYWKLKAYYGLLKCIIFDILYYKRKTECSIYLQSEGVNDIFIISEKLYGALRKRQKNCILCMSY